MNKRGAGILLHVTSLPSPYGIGDLGPWAYRFADFLAGTKQRYWQVLPLSPTSPIYGNSPYSSVSAFAVNTLFISPDLLAAEELVSRDVAADKPNFPEECCDYDAVLAYKESVFQVAWETFRTTGRDHRKYQDFCVKNDNWLDTYALFTALKKKFSGKAWNEWPREARDRVPEYLEAVEKECAEDMEREKFLQYIAFTQWHALKRYCNGKGIQLLGDIPIYVSFDSADAWAHGPIFKLDEARRPFFVAGVPPDYFSATGQLWGNPVYNWDVLRQTDFEWWIKRMDHVLKLFDMVRIDHFRGLVAYWEVPAHEKTAVNGEWVAVPTNDFFDALFRRFPHLPLIAEDLGIITQDVREAMERFGFPGMKVLLFAFGEENPMHPYLPHTYERKCVVYTGTHDNNTARGWFEKEARDEDRMRLFRYLGREVGPGEVSGELIRLAMMSVADTVILPLQDVLGLGQEARMNRPSLAGGNWGWRVVPAQLTDSVSEGLRSVTEIYGRA